MHHIHELIIKYCIILIFSIGWSLSPKSQSLQLDSIAVFFQSGSSLIDHDQQQRVANFVDSLYDRTQHTMVVRAHTDAIGSLEFNVDLSKKRALALNRFLVMHAIDSASISTHWFGETDSLSENRTAKGRELNRRVDLVILSKEPLVAFEGSVVDSNGTGLTSKVFIRNAKYRDSVVIDSSGKFKIMLPDSTVFALDVQAPGSIYQSVMFNTARQRSIELILRPIEAGVSFDLHRFYFYGNRADLLPESRPELNRLLRFLELNPTVYINIVGHINQPNAPKASTDSWEYDLSLRRAKMVHQFLIDHQVNSQRMTFEGLANWEMVFPYATGEIEMQKNRRVEIIIVDY